MGLFSRAPRDPWAKYGIGNLPPTELRRGTCRTCGRAIKCLWDLDPDVLATRPPHWFLADGPRDTSHTHEPTE